MTHLKKSLAVLLAFVMIFSSMSVAVSAFDPRTEGGFKLDFTVKFFRMERNEDGFIIDEDGNVVGDENDNLAPGTKLKDINWVETTVAKPGEDIKARIYVGTDFYTASPSMSVLFDSKYLHTPKYPDGMRTKVTVNEDYLGGVLDISSEHSMWSSDETAFAPNIDNCLVTEGIISATYFDDRDIISTLLTLREDITYVPTLLDASDWIVEYDFQVLDNELTRTVGEKGVARVPDELALTPTTPRPMFINFPKGTPNPYDSTFGMHLWDAEISSTEGYVTTSSNVVLDANGGFFIEGSSYTVEHELTGIIGDTVTGIGEVVPKKSDYAHSGWSTLPIPSDRTFTEEIKATLGLTDADVAAQGNILTEAQVAELTLSPTELAAFKYGYTEKTLYAVWTATTASDNYYTYQVYYMLPDGTYSDTPDFSQEILAENGATVTLPKIPVEGFTLDLGASDEVITVKGDKSSVLKAYYARNKYTVTYTYTDNSGVEQTQVHNVLYGAEIPAPDTQEFPAGYPVKEGYDFEGWETDDGQTVPKKMPAEDIVLVPVYDIKTFTYIFDATQGGKFESNGQRTYSFVYEYGATPDDFTEIPVFPGKEFLGWSEEIPGTVTSDITFVADFTDVEYTVTFMDGEDVIDEIPFFYGDLIFSDDVPEGYTAENSWYVEDAEGNKTVVEFPYTVTGNAVFYAEDSANVYDAEFYVDGELYATVPTIYEEQIEAPADPEKEGYTFVMWDPEVGLMDEDGEEFHAVFDINVTKITFVNTGETVIDPIEGEYNSDITAVIPTPVKKGYTFKGWNIPVPAKMPATDTEISAMWEKNSYTISFVNYDGSVIADVTAEYEAEVNAPALPVENGYTYEWDTEVPETMPAENMTINAVRTPLEFSISFDTNGADSEDIAPIENVNCGDPIEAPADPVKEGYTFGGWADVSNPDVPVEFPETMPAGGLDLIAIWTTNVHKAYFNANGGKFADDKTLYIADVEYGATIVAPADPTREDYIFDGWSPAPDKMIDEDMFFDAVWTPDPSGSVEYIINVITINPADNSEITTEVISNTAAAGETVEVIHKGETATADHSYNYEDLIDSVSNVLDEERTTGTKITVSVDGENVINVYCKLAEFEVTFLANGGKFSNDTGNIVVTGKYGEEIVVPEEPVRTGFTFTGWHKSPEGATFTADDAYVAQWEANTYNAIFNINGEEYVTVPYKLGETIVAPAYVPADDETFSGWYIPANTVMGPGDMTFDATLTKNVYTLSYSYSVAPAGAETPASVTGINSGDKVKLADATVIAGYTFNGWVYEGTTYAEGADFTMPNSNAAVVGSYTAIEYDVTYDTGFDDVTVPEDAVENATVGTEITLPVLEKEGYEFLGWDVDGVKYAPGADFTMPAGDVEFEAIWEEIPAEPEEYTVTYSWSGDIPADAVLPESDVYAEGTTVTVADVPASAGYTFNGWYYNGKLTESFVMPSNDVEIRGEWTKNPVPATKYDLVVDANGGTFANGDEVYSAQFEEGQTVVVPAGPTYDGFKFIGWVDAEGNASDIPGTMPANSVELTAVWSELYDITFNVDGAEYETVVDAGVEGDALPVPTKGEPTKDGFTFGGWADENGDIITTIPDGDAVLEAVWVPVEPDLYTIKYYDGANLLNTEEYEAGADIADYAPATKEGYTFNGWTGMPEDGKMPAEDLVVHADWSVNKNEITLNAGEGEFEDGTSIFTENDVPFGTELSGVVPAEPTREGYTFEGWVDENGNPATIPSTMPDEEINLTATWKIKSATVTFDAGEGEFENGTSTATSTGDYGTDIVVPADPTREGFKFKGWAGLPADGKIPEEDITVTAIWEAEPEVETYTLTIDAAGGKIDGLDKIVKELIEGEAIGAVSTPTRDGYVFTGWDKEIPATMPAEDLTITATWELEATPTHTVTYYLSKGDTTPYATRTFEEGETMVHPVPEAEGIVFKTEWVDADGNALPAVMGESDLVAYAVIDHIETYKATYVVEGATYQEYDVAYGAAVPVPADPSREGYLFAGWSPAAPATMPAEDLTFTALWEKIPEEGDKYAAKYVVDGNTYALYILEEGDMIPVPAAPTKFGFVFAGWEPEVPSTMPGEDMTFEAQWEIDKTFVAVVVGGAVVSGAVIGTAIGMNAALITGVSIIGGIIVVVGVSHLVKHTHTVTFKVDGEVYKTYKVVEGTKIPVPADPAKDGKIFKGWDPEVPEKMGDKDLVFEAQWASETDVIIPDTGSAAGLAAFAAISGAAAAAFVLANRKKKDEE